MSCPFDFNRFGCSALESVQFSFSFFTTICWSFSKIVLRSFALTEIVVVSSVFSTLFIFISSTIYVSSSGVSTDLYNASLMLLASQLSSYRTICSFNFSSFSNFGVMKESIPKATKMVNTNARPNARYIFEMKRIHGTAGKNSARISPPVYNRFLAFGSGRW